MRDENGAFVSWLIICCTLGLLLGLFTGCTPDAPTADVEALQDEFCAEIGLTTVGGGTAPAPAPAPSPDPATHAREQCPTGGWITHGDGHKTRCTLCDPPWPASEETPPAAAAAESAAVIPGRPEQTTPAQISPSDAARVPVESPAIIHHRGHWWRKVGGAWQIHHEGQWMTWHSFKLQFGAAQPARQSFTCEGGNCSPSPRFRRR